MQQNPKAIRSEAIAIWKAGVVAVDPVRLVREFAQTQLVPSFAKEKINKVLVVGAGKAGFAMAQGLKEGLPPSVDQRGLVLVPQGSAGQLGNVEVRAVRSAGVNLPTPEAMQGTLEILDLAANCPKNERIVVLVSGGGSALTPAPVSEISLEEKLQTTRILSQAGADIVQLNTVRKHLSRFKGGGFISQVTRSPLAQLRGAAPRVYSLIISDVIGDPLDVISSGPTVDDPSTFADSITICKSLGVWEELPPRVKKYLSSQFGKSDKETLKQIPRWVQNTVLGSNRVALMASQIEAEKRGWPVLNLGSFFDGDTRALSSFHLALLRSIRQGQPLPPPVCILSGGETTVRLGPNPGPGGRNQEFALSLLQTLKPEEAKGLCLLAAGTDGEDGPTPSAGGFVDAKALAQWQSIWNLEGSRVKGALDRNENHALLKELGALFSPGPTGTNVMDLRVGLVSS